MRVELCRVGVEQGDSVYAIPVVKGVLLYLQKIK